VGIFADRFCHYLIIDWLDTCYTFWSHQVFMWLHLFVTLVV